MSTAVVEKDQEQLPEVPEVRELSGLDRCDRCIAAAIMLAIHKTTDRELLFCQHHGRQHKDQLESQNFVVYDQSDRLLTENRLVDEDPVLEKAKYNPGGLIEAPE